MSNVKVCVVNLFSSPRRTTLVQKVMILLERKQYAVHTFQCTEYRLHMSKKIQVTYVQKNLFPDCLCINILPEQSSLINT